MLPKCGHLHSRHSRKDVPGKVACTVIAMAVDESLLAELKRTKAEIDRLQIELKSLVARLQEGGATNEDIKQALRS